MDSKTSTSPSPTNQSSPSSPWGGKISREKEGCWGAGRGRGLRWENVPFWGLLPFSTFPAKPTQTGTEHSAARIPAPWGPQGPHYPKRPPAGFIHSLISPVCFLWADDRDPDSSEHLPMSQAISSPPTWEPGSWAPSLPPTVTTAVNVYGVISIHLTWFSGFNWRGRFWNERWLKWQWARQGGKTSLLTVLPLLISFLCYHLWRKRVVLFSSFLFPWKGRPE